MNDFGPPTDAKFAPVPDGSHECVVVDVTDDGVETHPEYGTKPKLSIIWECSEENPDTNERYQLRQKYTNTMHERGNLRPAIEAMLGRGLTDAELVKLQYKEFLVGMNCRIRTKQKPTSSGRIRANPEDISDNPEGTMVPKDYAASTSDGNAETVEDHFEVVRKQVTAQTLSGVQFNDIWMDKSNGEMFVLVKLDFVAFKDSIEKARELNNQVKEYIRQNSERLHDELREEEEKRQ